MGGQGAAGVDQTFFGQAYNNIIMHIIMGMGMGGMGIVVRDDGAVNCYSKAVRRAVRGVRVGGRVASAGSSCRRRGRRVRGRCGLRLLVHGAGCIATKGVKESEQTRINNTHQLHQ